MTVVILFLQLPTPFFSGPKFRSVHQPVNLQKAPRNEKKKRARLLEFGWAPERDGFSDAYSLGGPTPQYASFLKMPSATWVLSCLCVAAPNRLDLQWRASWLIPVHGAVSSTYGQFFGALLSC
jgi:hypothetical protein